MQVCCARSSNSYRRIDVVKRYRANSLTVNPVNMRYTKRGTVIEVPGEHRHNPNTGLLEVPTTEVVAGSIVWCSATHWDPVDGKRE